MLFNKKEELPEIENKIINEIKALTLDIAASNGFFFEVENVRHHEHEQSFVEGAQ